MSETDNNSNFSESFYITVIGISMSALAGFLGFILKSRCTRIKCWGCECQRAVITEENLQDASVRFTPTVPVSTTSNAV